jgi:hypothetical protein
MSVGILTVCWRDVNVNRYDTVIKVWTFL